MLHRVFAYLPANVSSTFTAAVIIRARKKLNRRCFLPKACLSCSDDVDEKLVNKYEVETFCSTYNPDVYVVVYSVVDRKSMKAAEEILLYLWKSDYMSARGVILVGNKADLERKREVPTAVGRKLANNCGCKFIETSSGLDHNVDELLVGILAQVQLNPRRNLSKKKKRLSNGKRILKHLLGLKRKSKSCENLFIL